MDNGQPDQKRPRIGSWNAQQSRELPQLLPPSAPFPQHGPPYPRPEPQPHLLDNHRRLSEHGQYDPEPRAPSSAPAHGYQPGPQHPPAPPYTGPRDAMIKRDPSDEPHPPQFRPPATGPAPDHAVAAPPPERYHHPHLDPSTSAAPFRPPYPPPQSPMPGPEPYSQYNGFPPHARDPYQSIPYSSAAAAAANAAMGKKKAQRAAQACDSCRTLKAKCDEGRPHCGSCKEKGTPCVYRDPPPKQVDKASADIIESLMRLEAGMKLIDGRLARLEGAPRRASAPDEYASFATGSDAELKQEDGEETRPAALETQTSGAESAPQSGKPEPAVPITPSHFAVPEAIGGEDVDAADLPAPLQLPVDDDEEEPGEDIRPGKPSIPVNHTTPAARLLLVPAIANLTNGIVLGEKIKFEKYPILQEAKRGVLRLYGRGEGVDRPPGYDREPLQDLVSESTPSDANSDVSSPAGEEWGQVGGMTPVGEDTAPPVQRGTVIDIEGMPDFSRETVLKYVDSYNRNLNIMHPILIPRHLNALVDVFLRSIPASSIKSRQAEGVAAYAPNIRGPTASFVGLRNPESPGQKRKRSPVTTAESPDLPSASDLKPGHPFRSISTALVLLVMALGEICEHKKKLYDISNLQNDDQSVAGSPQMRNGHPRSPAQTSPTISTSTGLPSPYEGDRMYPRSRRTSADGTAFFVKNRSRPRNIDLIPGLPYFALATDILGNQMGGNSLQHVHANILAGLYQGQLGRVCESHSFINNACRALQHILRPKLDRLQKDKRNGTLVHHKDNPIVFAFWTCLQLESDILAELPYPHSGILTYEEDMPSPNLQAARDIDGISDIVLESYSAQLYLRKHLNMLHAMFYNPDGMAWGNDTSSSAPGKGDKPGYYALVKACEEMLNQINIIAPNLKWDENDTKDPFARDILGARLRAKFYGARVITYRDFVVKILQRSTDGKSRQYSGSGAKSFSVASSPDTDIEPIIIQYAEQCIKALVKSTVSFHGCVKDIATDRLIVTNIWGTAHAQWGNVLTLQAAYMDPVLTHFVDPTELKDLLQKTLSFLRLHAHQSSALYTDYRILRYAGRVTGLLSDKDHPHTASASSSFSSQ